MKKLKPSHVFFSVVCFMLTQQNFAQTSSERESTSTTIITNVESNDQQNTLIINKSESPNSEIIEGVPSSLHFLVKECELKDGYYYLSEDKFQELSLSQQEYIKNNKTKFIIQKPKE